MIRTLLSVLSLANAAYAYQMPTLVARTAVRYQRAASISMVDWDKVPAETKWTKDAWEAMHLSGAGLHGCVAIPVKFANPDGTRDPSAGLKTVRAALTWCCSVSAPHKCSLALCPAHLYECIICCALPELIGRVHLACPQYYFCTYNGAQKAGANCIELPTYDEEIGLYLCTMGHGARPSYDDD